MCDGSPSGIPPKPPKPRCQRKHRCIQGVFTQRPPAVKTTNKTIAGAAAQAKPAGHITFESNFRHPDENGVDRANDALRKAMSRSALVDDLKKLADVDEKVRKGEREAFGPDVGAKPENEGLAAMATAELQKLRERLMHD